MTDARSAILQKSGALINGRYTKPAPVLPEFVQQSDSMTQLLKRKLEAVQSSVDIVHSVEETGQSIVDFLNTHHCSMEVGTLPGTDLESLSLDQGLQFFSCENFADCHTVITRAPFGIAETGTVVMPSSIQRPTLANFLPDNCIVLLNESDILPYIEDALLAVQKSDAGMPRALNLISGPSKTADIEQTLVYGAHGPIQLHVIIRANSASG